MTQHAAQLGCSLQGSRGEAACMEKMPKRVQQWRIGKEDGIVFSHGKGRSPAICDHMGKPGRQGRQRKTQTACCHINVESQGKKKSFIETK